MKGKFRRAGPAVCVVAAMLAGPAGVGAGPVRPQATGTAGTEVAALEGTGDLADAAFGAAVAISGPTIVVGASGYASGKGRADVFTRTAAGWRRAAELEGHGTVADDGFGGSVAISGTTIVVGAEFHGPSAGRAYVFTKTARGWQQTARLEGPGTMANDVFGESVAISGPTIVVGAFGSASRAGRAYVFTRAAAGWHQTAELKGSDTVAGDDFAVSVGVSGTTVVAGAVGHSSAAGRAYVFTRAAAGWHQTAELKGSDTVAGDQFGRSVAISGQTIAAGAVGHAAHAGRAYVFARGNAGWQQTAELKGPDTTGGDVFGQLVAVSGTTVVVGAPFHASASGGAYLFAHDAGGWHQTAELKGSDTVAYDNFGASVAVSGTIAVVGAPFHGSGDGRVYLFEAP